MICDIDDCENVAVVRRKVVSKELLDGEHINWWITRCNKHRKTRAKGGTVKEEQEL